jgi:hypothetical protein
VKFGKKVIATDQRKLPGFRDEKVELARGFARHRPTPPLRRPELLAQQL